ncbi:hypothetical protein GTR02_08660 [Kineococcus sp. R8]|nr:hypothetical protein [Kineococcus siccus]
MDLVAEFLNTLDERTFTRYGENHVATDGLTSIDAFAAWMEARDLGDSGAALHSADLQAARTLRTSLRATLTAAASGDEVDDSARQLLAGFPLHLVPDSSSRLRITAASGVPGLDVIVEAVATNVAAGRWHRLKLCASVDCRWAFHDTSRSGGGRWCSMDICGNRHKTRAYRRRATS